MTLFSEKRRIKYKLSFYWYTCSFITFSYIFNNINNTQHILVNIHCIRDHIDISHLFTSHINPWTLGHTLLHICGESVPRSHRQHRISPMRHLVSFAPLSNFSSHCDRCCRCGLYSPPDVPLVGGEGRGRKTRILGAPPFHLCDDASLKYK